MRASSRAISFETVDGVIIKSRAASEKFPASTTRTNTIISPARLSMTLLLFVPTLAHAVRAPQARPGSDPSLLLQDELTRTNGSLYETGVWPRSWSISTNPFHRAGFGVDLAQAQGRFRAWAQLEGPPRPGRQPADRAKSAIVGCAGADGACGAAVARTGQPALGPLATKPNRSASALP